MQAANSGPAQCVLWRDPRAAEPGALSAALSGRGVQVTRVTGPYAALGEVCRLGRGGAKVILLLVEPGTLGQSGLVFDALQRFAPRAACWAYEERANPKLRAVVESEVESWPGGHAEPEPAPEVVIRTRVGQREAPVGRPAGPGPQLRLVDEGGLDPVRQRSEMNEGGEGEEPLPGPPPRNMLTAEELAMLLGEEGPGWNADR